MRKKLIGSIVVFVTLSLCDFLIHGIIMDSAYKETVSLWRPDMESKMWIFNVITLIGSVIFTFIFSKGYEAKGVFEGARFGFIVGIWLSLGMAYGTYGMIALPYKMALQWFLYGVLEYMIAGIALALVYDKVKETAPSEG